MPSFYTTKNKLTGDKANELVMIATESSAWPLKSMHLYLYIIYKYKYLSTAG